MTDPERYYSAGRVRLRQLRQLLYPRRCPFCRRVLGLVPACESCAGQLERLEHKPSRRLDPGDHYLGALEGAAAPFFYRDEVREAILRAKYQGESWTAVQLGCWIARLLFGAEIRVRGGVELPCPEKTIGFGYDLVVPVPSSGKGRGYNVPSLMALPVARALCLPMDEKALLCLGKARPQAGLSLDERLVNVAGAVKAPDPDRVEGRRVLLLDDVITTGATAAACAHALMDAGAQSVFAVSLATAGEGKPLEEKF